MVYGGMDESGNPINLGLLRRPKKAAKANPQKSVQAMTQPASSRLGIDELLRRNVVGGQVLAPLTQQLGIPDWQYSGGGMDESGNPINLGVADPGLAQTLAGYSFDWNDTGPANTGTLSAFDQTGAQIGQYAQQDQSALQGVIEAAALAAAGFGGVGLMGLGPLGGVLGGAGAAGTAGGGGSTAGGLIGAGEGAAQLAAYTAANPLTAAQVVGATLPAGGLPGLASTAGGLLGAGEGLAQLASYSAANPLTAAQVTASALPAGGLPGLSSGLLAGVPAETLASLEAYSAANPVTMGQVSAGIPQIAAPAMSAAPAFNAAADSQLASSQLGITGAEAAAAATAPATVNLGSLGGTMGTAGGLSGLLQTGQQVAGDALGSATDLLSPAAAWMKANPQLGRLLMGGATSLLSGMGGSSAGSTAAAAPSGPPVQWNSGLQQGLLSPVQQYAPAAVQQNRPAGLLARGYENSGAWRFMGG